MGYKNTEGATMTALQRLVEAAENLLRNREALNLYVYLDAVQDAIASAKSELEAMQAAGVTRPEGLGELFSEVDALRSDNEEHEWLQHAVAAADKCRGKE